MESGCIQELKKSVTNSTIERQPLPSLIKGDTIVFEKTQVVIQNSSTVAFLIFKKGLLSPTLIMSASTYGDRRIIKSTISNIGSVTINSFSETKISGQPATVRTFTFLRWASGHANPYMYILQLTNTHANAETSLDDFIEGAYVSVFGFCSILV